MYSANSKNLTCFSKYLNVRKQYIKIAKFADTVKQDIKLGVSQKSILGPSLSQFYVNDLPSSSSVLVPAMFADDTNLKTLLTIKTVFKRVHDELIKINKWFLRNKLFLGVGKTKLCSRQQA